MRKITIGMGALLSTVLLLPLAGWGQESSRGRALLDEVEVIDLGEDRVLSDAERNPPGSLADLPGGFSSARIRTRGLEAPEEGAIGILFANAERLARDLTESDRLLLFSARARIADRRVAEAGFRDICRGVLALSEAEFDDVRAGRVARALVRLQEQERQRVGAEYRRLLARLSADGAAHVDDFKVRVHKRSVSNDPDWLADSAAEPAAFMRRQADICARL